MVRKIRAVNPNDDDADEEFKTKLIEFLKAIDWKLWEMLKIHQELNEKLDQLEIMDDTDGTRIRKIIVDEE